MSQDNVTLLIRVFEVLGLAWIAYKQFTVSSQIKDVHSTVNSALDKAKAELASANQRTADAVEKANSRAMELASTIAAAQSEAAYERGKASAALDLESATKRAFEHGREAGVAGMTQPPPNHQDPTNAGFTDSHP